jgi:hypothetical protein
MILTGGNMKKALVQNESTKQDEPINEVPLACADEKAAVEFMEKQRWGEHVSLRVTYFIPAATNNLDDPIMRPRMTGCQPLVDK